MTEKELPKPLTESQATVAHDFVTVGQAAKLLAVSDRTARRMAGQLADSDRTPDTGHGRRVRLAAMQALRSEALQQRGKGTSSFHVETTPGQDSDTVTGQWPDSGHGHPVNGRSMAGQHDRLDASFMAEGSNLLAELATLRAEKEGLLARLADTASDRDAWKDQAGKLDTRLAEALGALQQAQSETRAARALSSRSAMQIEAVSPSDGSQSSPDPLGGTIPSPDTTKRPFWAFWKGKG